MYQNFPVKYEVIHDVTLLSLLCSLKKKKTLVFHECQKLQENVEKVRQGH